jgi:hypothetical protein
VERANTALPALLLNGVHVATGKRIVTSNLRVSDIPIADTYDVFQDVLEVDIPVSTAVHNNARFTYVSPAGTLRQGGTGASRGRIVGGGYFENFGVATALETLVAVSDELKATKKNFRPFIIQISNDPKVEEFASRFRACRRRRAARRRLVQKRSAGSGLRAAEHA